MGRMIDEAKIKITCETFTDADGEILVPLSAVRQAIAMTPAADVVSLDDVRQAFENYILEMTCSKYGTPQETQFARDIVRQAVDIVLGERKEQT